MDISFSRYWLVLMTSFGGAQTLNFFTLLQQISPTTTSIVTRGNKFHTKSLKIRKFNLVIKSFLEYKGNIVELREHGSKNPKRFEV